MGPVLNVLDKPVEKIDLRISPTVADVSFMLNTIGETRFEKMTIFSWPDENDL